MQAFEQETSMEKIHKIEEYGVSFVSTQKLERTYTILFSLYFRAVCLLPWPFETSMAASKLRRARFGHLRIDF